MGSHRHYLRPRERIETVSIGAELDETRRVALIEPIKGNQAARLEGVRSRGIVGTSGLASTIPTLT